MQEQYTNSDTAISVLHSFESLLVFSRLYSKKQVFLFHFASQNESATNRIKYAYLIAINLKLHLKRCAIITYAGEHEQNYFEECDVTFFPAREMTSVMNLFPVRTNQIKQNALITASTMNSKYPQR